MSKTLAQANLDDQDVLIQFDETAFGPFSPGTQNFEDQVNEAQEQLSELRQRQELLERQKRELEELHRKRDEFNRGRVEVTERLARAIARLERDAVDAQKLADHCLESRDSFQHHLRALGALRPEMWRRESLREELTGAIAQIDEAQDEYNQAVAVIETLRSSSQIGTEIAPLDSGSARAFSSGNFRMWLLNGLAFTLPLILFGTIALALFLLLGGSGAPAA